MYVVLQAIMYVVLQAFASGVGNLRQTNLPKQPDRPSHLATYRETYIQLHSFPCRTRPEWWLLLNEEPRSSSNLLVKSPSCARDVSALAFPSSLLSYITNFRMNSVIIFFHPAFLILGSLTPEQVHASLWLMINTLVVEYVPVSVYIKGPVTGALALLTLSCVVAAKKRHDPFGESDGPFTSLVRVVRARSEPYPMHIYS